jgi:hypothetical protein
MNDLTPLNQCKVVVYLPYVVLKLLKYFTLGKLGVTLKQHKFQIIIRLEFAFVGKCLMNLSYCL